MPIHSSWNEKKRQANLKQHKLDFADAIAVFEGLTFTFEDSRFNYSEQRFITLGLLAGMVVSIVHTECEGSIHIISFRKASRNEAHIFFESFQNRFAPTPQDERH